MGKKSQSFLARKLIVFTVGVSACFALLISLVQVVFDYQTDFSKIEASIDHLERVSVKSLGTAIWYLDTVQIDTILDGVQELPNIQQVVLFTTGKKQEPTVVGKVSSNNTLEREFPITYEIGESTREVGLLRIHITLDELYWNVISKFLVGLGGNMVKTLSVSLLLVFYIRRTITGRLDR